VADFTSNLELYFAFDEGTGTTATHLSGISRHGTLPMFWLASASPFTTELSVVG
jgi:hypothetical protein